MPTGPDDEAPVQDGPGDTGASAAPDAFESFLSTVRGMVHGGDEPGAEPGRDQVAEPAAEVPGVVPDDGAADAATPPGPTPRDWVADEEPSGWMPGTWVVDAPAAPRRRAERGRADGGMEKSLARHEKKLRDQERRNARGSRKKRRGQVEAPAAAAEIATDVDAPTSRIPAQSDPLAVDRPRDVEPAPESDLEARRDRRQRRRDAARAQAVTNESGAELVPSGSAVEPSSRGSRRSSRRARRRDGSARAGVGDSSDSSEPRESRETPALSRTMSETAPMSQLGTDGPTTASSSRPEPDAPKQSRAERRFERKLAKRTRRADARSEAIQRQVAAEAAKAERDEERRLAKAERDEQRRLAKAEKREARLDAKVSSKAAAAAKRERHAEEVAARKEAEAEARAQRDAEKHAETDAAAVAAAEERERQEQERAALAASEAEERQRRAEEEAARAEEEAARAAADAEERQRLADEQAVREAEEQVRRDEERVAREAAEEEERRLRDEERVAREAAEAEERHRLAEERAARDAEAAEAAVREREHRVAEQAARAAEQAAARAADARQRLEGKLARLESRATARADKDARRLAKRVARADARAMAEAEALERRQDRRVRRIEKRRARADARSAAEIEDLERRRERRARRLKKRSDRAAAKSRDEAERLERRRDEIDDLVSGVPVAAPDTGLLEGPTTAPPEAVPLDVPAPPSRRERRRDAALAKELARVASDGTPTPDPPVEEESLAAYVGRVDASILPWRSRRSRSRVPLRVRRAARVGVVCALIVGAAALPWVAPRVPGLIADAVPGGDSHVATIKDPAVEPPSKSVAGPVGIATQTNPLDGQRLAAAGWPRRVVVPRLHVDSTVVPISGQSGSLLPPSDPQVLGWWREGRPVGAEFGSAVITGHTVHTGGGALDNLDKLAVGDTLRVRTDDGWISYVVQRAKIYSTSELARDAADVFRLGGPGRLVLITCDDWNGTFYESNAVVFASPTTDDPFDGPGVGHVPDPGPGSSS